MHPARVLLTLATATTLALLPLLPAAGGWRPGHELPPDPAVTAAGEGLRQLQRRATENPGGLGFKPADVRLLTLGGGVRVYTIDERRLPEARPDEFPSLLRPRDEWLFFVLLRGECRSMLWVAREGDTYRTVSIGNEPQSLYSYLQQAAGEADPGDPGPRVVQCRGLTLIVPPLDADTIWVATGRHRPRLGLRSGTYPPDRVLRALRSARQAPPPGRPREPAASSEGLLPLAATVALLTAGAARFACGLTEDDPRGERSVRPPGGGHGPDHPAC